MRSAFTSSPCPESRARRNRGVVIPTMFFIILLSALAGTTLSLSLTSFKFSHRNDARMRARVVAESELEFIYYTFKELLITGTAVTPNDIPTLLAGICDNADQPETAHVPFALIHRGADPLDPNPGVENEDWIVKRSIIVAQSNIEGIIPDSNGKQGTFSYLNARITVTPGPSSPLHNKLTLTVGRRFSYATASIFQYNVFSQGDLEFNPGGNTVIEGDIAANGSVYMGATSGSLTIKGYVRHLKDGYFNATTKTDNNGVALTSEIEDDPALLFESGDDSTALATTYRKPGTMIGSTLVTATDATVTWEDGEPVAKTSVNLIAPTFTTSEAAQVAELDTAENLLGGLDAKSLATSHPELFGPVNDLPAAMNNVYRSIIAPPPEAVYDATGSNFDVDEAEYPAGTNLSTVSDNPEISALRAYNRAGLVITVAPDGDDADSNPEISVKDQEGTDHTAALASVISAATLHDLREGKNVAITQIDVGALDAALQADGDLGAAFNGLLYVHLANSNSTTPAAVRLINAEKTPGSETASGFSVATNGGLYVQGNYNTTTQQGTQALDETNTDTVNPTMLMADSITVLSKDWDDANSANPDITSRPANTTTNVPVVLVPAVVVLGIEITPAVMGTEPVTTAANLVINAGILTGNVSATDANASGGGQNLVRYLENWNVDIATGANGRTVRLDGSIGRLFDSRHYTAAFQQPAQYNADTELNEGTYRTPVLRTFAFNDTLKTESSRPPGSPIITYFDRGNFFSDSIN
jgi:hypothetical protein